MKKSVINVRPYVDELDLRLIEAIKRNARISYHELASNVGTSPQTASRRVNRLVDDGIIKIIAITDYAALGYKTILILAINAPPGTLDKLTRQLININSIKYLLVTTGRYDILAVAVYRSLEEYLKLFPKEMAGISKNVKIEVMSTAKVVKSYLSQLTDRAVDDTYSDFIPTDLDLSVMRGLAESPRAPVTELAHNIGANITSVHISLRRLLSRGIIKVISFTTPAVDGYNIRGITLIQIHPSKVGNLIKKLRAHPSVDQMTLILGAFNCMIWTSFENSKQMRQFLVRYLGSMPGVVHYESLIVLGEITKVQPMS